MRVIVLGANGFIGSYLCDHLMGNHSVIAISRKFAGVFQRKLTAVKTIRADVLQEGFLQIREEADVCIHLATPNDIISKDFNQGIDLALKGTKNAIEFCKINGIKKFIFFSTLQVYGTELNGHYNDQSFARPLNNYGYNHLVAEEYVRLAANRSEIEGLIIRPANIYGAMIDRSIDRWSLVPNCFCEEAIQRGTITLQSSGKQMRNFISLKNICVSTETFLQEFKKEPVTINLVSNSNYPIIKFAEWTIEVCKERLGIDVVLNITRNEPLQGNKFSFDTSYLQSLGLSIEESPGDIKNEIYKILSLITKTN
jgi:UDP-glucose 4-epimerase